MYANSLTAPFVLDDFYSLEFFGKKPIIEHLLHGSSRRIVDVTFAINYQIHGLQISGYHLINLVLHLCTAVMVYFLSTSFVLAAHRSVDPEHTAHSMPSLAQQVLPVITALIFVLHPLQTQAVTYIIQRYTSVATLFYLLAVYVFIAARRQLDDCGTGWRVTALFTGSFVAGCLAVASKQIAVTLPLMLILAEACLFRGRLLNRRFVYLCVGLLLLASAVIFFVWRNSSLSDFLFDVRHATSEALYFSRSSYFYTQLRVIVTYLRLLVFPVGQSLVHDAVIYQNFLNVPVVASAFLHVSLLGASGLLLRRSNMITDQSRVNSAVLQRLAAFGVFWFYCAHLIESSVFPIRDVMFEHRLYLPSVGLLMTLVALFLMAAERWHVVQKSIWGVVLIISLLLGSLTIARNRVWNDSLLLWQESAAMAPGKWLALVNLAGEYMDRHMPVKALPLYVRALELNPGLFLRSKVCLGESLKSVKQFEGRFTTGNEFVLAGGLFGSGTINYKYMSRWDATISNNHGLGYEYLNEPQKALQSFMAAVSIDPTFALGWYNLGLMAARLGDNVKYQMSLIQLQTLEPSLAGKLVAQTGH